MSTVAALEEELLQLETLFESKIDLIRVSDIDDADEHYRELLHHFEAIKIKEQQIDELRPQ